jgi:RNA polymerase sigma-70 factor (ECF subfamily)
VDADSVYERLLVLRSQMGDPHALAELVARYSQRLRYFLRKLTGSPDAVDDLLQDTWLDVLRGLPRLGAAEAFRVWLYRIAHDRAMAWLRKQCRLAPTVDPAAVAEEFADDDPPQLSPDDVQAIHQALDDLPAEQREALVLRFLEGLSYDEIARVTQTPVGTVRSRLFYGKQALRGKLSGD